MGFPTWTLWGMGIAGLFALLFNTLALMAQSGRSLLFGRRLDARARSLTGFGLAATLLAFGFFMAGVPLDGVMGETDSSTALNASVSSQIIVVTATYTPTSIGEVASIEESATRPPSGTPQTGAFVPLTTAESDATESGTADEATETITPAPDADETDEATATPKPATVTPTPTPAPTNTPFPTLTPTPIDGKTAVVITQSGLTWLYDAPGGQQAGQVFDGDVLILRGGHANRDGNLWQEVMTVNGRLGWIPEEFLITEE